MSNLKITSKCKILGHKSPCATIQFDIVRYVIFVTKENRIPILIYLYDLSRHHYYYSLLISKSNARFICVLMPCPTTQYPYQAMMNLKENYANHLLRTCYNFAAGTLLRRHIWIKQIKQCKNKAELCEPLVEDKLIMKVSKLKGLSR